MKKIVLISTILCLCYVNILAQTPTFNNTISINATYTSDTEIFPFNRQRMNGVGIKGNLTLNSDTSLVRIILKDSLSYEYMVLESYPMIDTVWSFSFNEECEETCFMDGFTPTSLLVYVSDASIYLDNIQWSSIPVGNPVSLQLSAKANKVSSKLADIEDYIDSEYLVWNADHTDDSDMFYWEKVKNGSLCLEIPGIEFYEKGIFAIKGLNDTIIKDYDYVMNFDWRNRHGANIPNTYYYDNDPDGGGWLTSLKCQYACFENGEFDCSIPSWECDISNPVIDWRETGLCWAFCPTAHVESMINLYLNKQVDYDLSEQNLASCAKSNPTINAWSTYKGYRFYRDYGVVDEESFPFEALPVSCDTSNPIDKIWIDSYNYTNDINHNIITEDSLRKIVIKHGPIGISRFYINTGEQTHAIQLVGWDAIEWSDIDSISNVPDDPAYFSPWLGATYWIYKESKGTHHGNNGFYYVHHYREIPPRKTYVIPTDSSDFVYSEYNSFTEDSINVVDNDGDGYWNWGIGPKPEGCTECSDARDWDDNNSGLGPINEYGFCSVINTYNSGFETTMNNWKQSDDDNCDWIKDSGQADNWPDSGPNGTPDSSTYYMIMKYAACLAHAHAYLESPPILMSDYCGIKINFAYHKNSKTWNNPQHASLSIDISYDEGLTWQNDYWFIDGDLGDQWFYETVHMPANVNKIRFHGYAGHISEECDIAIDDITISPVISTGNPIVISSDTTWNSILNIPDNIEITNSATLTLDTKCVLRLFEDVKIIVEQGSKLIIDSAQLTSACGELWDGIQVWGDPTSPYTTDQGELWIQNNAVIENATFALRNCSYNDETFFDDYGGVIVATDATFKNNYMAGDFKDYPYTSSLYFEDCEFITDDDYTGSITPQYFIRVDDINRLQIVDCEFTNSTSTDHYQDGVYSDNSYVRIYNDNGVNTFTNLDYGIYAVTSTAGRYMDVRNSNFVNNKQGIYLSGMTSPRVTSNTFKIDVSSTNGGYGLYLDECTGYHVEDNVFEKCTTCVSQTGTGIIVNESGNNVDEIYLNEFNHVEYAVNAQGVNRISQTSYPGLVIKCNDYNNTLNDETVINTGGSKMPSDMGISGKQGVDNTVAEDMAGNIFYYETSSTDYDDLNNEANHFDYYYSTNAGYADVEPEDATWNTVTKHPKGTIAQWTHATACQSGLNPGGGGGLKSGGEEEENLKGLLVQYSGQIDSLETILQVMTDGGDTETLNNEVETSIPSEAVEVYNELMGESPNLSETVVESTIEQESVLPNAMVRDVMVANPHTSKSQQLLDKLEERFTPMPDYMKAQILAGRSIQTLKQELESQLSGYMLKKSRTLNTLARYYRQELEDSDQATDSLIALYQQDNSLNSHYHLAWLYLDKGEYQLGENIISGIPTNFALTEGQQSKHTDMEAVYNILSGLQESGGGVDSLSAGQLESLQSIASEGEIPARAYARNILLTAGELQYDEPILFPDAYKSAKAMESYNTVLESEAPGQLSVYPNPSTGFVILEYKLESETEAILEIRDVNGRTIHSMETEAIQNQLTVVTRDWKPGIYIASLIIDGKSVESVKFTLTK